MKINELFENIKVTAESTVQQSKDNNFFYLPKFIDRLLKIAKEFPLWTGVCIPFYTSHPTTSYCERVFLDIRKDVFRNYSLPQGVENFLKIHLRDLMGGTRSFASKMQNFIENEKTVLTWRPKDFHQNATIRPIAETSTICEDSIQMVKIEHDYSKSFNDSDLLSRENWRGKAEPLFLINENQGKTEDVLNDITESNNENVEQLVEEDDIDIPTFISCDTDDLSLSILLNSENQIIENQSSSSKVIETEENNVKTFIYVSPLLINGNIKSDVIVEQQKDAQLERKYLEPKPSHSKFFSAYPEVKLNNKLFTKNVKRYLLKNATSCGTYLIDEICFLRNTCPFDSIAQIVFTSVLDDSAYHSIAKNSDNAFFKFILKFMNNGPSRQMYKDIKTLV